jgi:flagellar motor switch protein FliG
VAEPANWDRINGRRKAAIFLLSLGSTASAEVVKNLDEREIEMLASEIASIGTVPPNVKERVLKEMASALSSTATGGLGGVGKAEELLEAALGKSRASEIVGKMKMRKGSGALRKIEELDSGTVAEFLKGEHPQTVALIIAHLQPQAAANMLGALPEDQRADVARRIATLGTISPDAATEVEQILASQLDGLGKAAEAATASGVKILADILNVADRSTEKEVLGAISDESPEVANQVKQLLFVFDDILKLDDRAVQRVLREVDTNDLALALKAADEEIKKKILDNVSERAAEMIQEEIEYMGPKRLSEVEAAQLRIIEVIRSLEEANEIIIPGRGGGSGDTVV